MDSHRRTALTALTLGAAIVVSISAPAYARTHHPATHAARHVVRHAARPPDAAIASLPLPPYMAASDAEVDAAAGFAPPSPATHGAKHRTRHAGKAPDASPDFLAPSPVLSAIGPEIAEAAGFGPPQPPGHHPPGLAGRLAHWVAAADDNGDLPFMIVDKLGAEVYAFDAAGDFLGSAPVLLGLARGDDSAPGLGGLKLSQISDEERTTPAGRFVAEFGRSEGHGTMLWVDFADAISMHPVMSVNAGEHRLERIKSADPDDHRISYGCINVPKTFYDGVVLPALDGGHAIVYVMPDTKPIEEVFPVFAAAAHVRHEEDRPSRRVSSADLLSDQSDRIPSPQPTRLDRVDDRQWRAPPM